MEDQACIQILQVIPRVCGLELGKVGSNQSLSVNLRHRFSGMFNCNCDQVPSSIKKSSFISLLQPYLFVQGNQELTILKIFKESLCSEFNHYTYFSRIFHSYLKQEPRLDPECNEFRLFLFDHPCNEVVNPGETNLSSFLLKFLLIIIYFQTQTHSPQTLYPPVTMRGTFVLTTSCADPELATFKGHAPPETANVS